MKHSDKPIYMDFAAATPMDLTVLDAIKPFFTELFYNPSEQYLAAKNVKAKLESARQTIGLCLSARPSEIFFTAGGTEANNLAIFGIMHKYPDANLVVSAIEHVSVIEPAKRFESRLAKVDDKGVVDVKSLKKQIDDKTVLVSVMYANNEVGSIQPLREIATLIAEIKNQRKQSGNTLPIYLHTDACQAANYLDLQVSRLGVDLMTLNGGKIYGPKQSGVLFVRAGVVLEPLVRGGGQEHNLRSGTENVAQGIGFAAALQLVQNLKKAEMMRLSELQKLFFDELAKKIPRAQVNGARKNRLPNNIHLTIQGTDNERLMMQLDELGVQCATGSACSASKDTPSHVLRAMGLSDDDARSSLRFTLGRSTTADNVVQTVAMLASCV